MLKSATLLLRETIKEWNEDNATHIAAALAYYAIFSLSPLLIVIALILGLVIDQRTVETGLVENIELTLGQQAAQLIGSLLVRRPTASDVVGSVIWLAIILWGASGMFAQLQLALNKIWEVRPKPGRSPLVILKIRLQSFMIVALAAIALLGSMVVNTALSARLAAPIPVEADYLELGANGEQLAPEAEPLSALIIVPIRVIQFLVSLAVMTFMIVVVFQVLPDVDIGWRDVIVGSLFTAVLLYLGQFGVGLYLSRADVGSIFGAAGSLTVILVWIYYSAQILLFGAEFTEVWARHHGSHIRPDADAVWENEFKAKREAERSRRLKADTNPSQD